MRPFARVASGPGRACTATATAGASPGRPCGRGGAARRTGRRCARPSPGPAAPVRRRRARAPTAPARTGPDRAGPAPGCADPARRSHVGPVNVGNGASGAPPAAPVALTCWKQSTARPSASFTRSPLASACSPTGTYSSGWSNGADWFLHARVGERPQERDEVVLLAVGQAERLQVRALLRVGEVAAAVVEVDDLAQRQRAAVVEVRRGELDVAQAGHLERAVDRVASRGRRSGGPPTAGSPTGSSCRRGPGRPPSGGRRCCRSRRRSSGRACRARCRSRPGRRRRSRAWSRSSAPGRGGTRCSRPCPGRRSGRARPPGSARSCRRGRSGRPASRRRRASTRTPGSRGPRRARS